MKALPKEMRGKKYRYKLYLLGFPDEKTKLKAIGEVRTIVSFYKTDEADVRGYLIIVHDEGGRLSLVQTDMSGKNMTVFTGHSRPDMEDLEYVTDGVFSINLEAGEIIGFESKEWGKYMCNGQRNLGAYMRSRWQKSVQN